MAQTYTNLIAKIKAKLEALVDGDSVAIFKAVYDHAEGDFSGYPCAVIIDKGGAGKTIDTHRTERAFTFEITLYQEQSQAAKTKAEAAAIMRSITDQVIQSFDEDPQLGGEVMRVQVVDVVLDFTIKQGTFNFARFTIQCNDLVNTHT